MMSDPVKPPKDIYPLLLEGELQKARKHIAEIGTKLEQERAKVAQMQEALKAIDGFWTDGFPNGPVEESLAKEGTLSRLLNVRLSAETVAIWTLIRAALADAGATP